MPLLTHVPRKHHQPHPQLHKNIAIVAVKETTGIIKLSHPTTIINHPKERKDCLTCPRLHSPMKEEISHLGSSISFFSLPE